MPASILHSSTIQTLTLAGTTVQVVVPDAAVVKVAYHQDQIPFPYWAKVWPAALGLSSFLITHSHLIKNKKVTELGAGLGLPSLVAARYAASVLCTDYVADAIALAQQSALHNQLTNFTTAIIDWNQLPDDFSADVVLLSDVNYEPGEFDNLLQLIYKFSAAGSLVVLSTPQRLPAKAFITPLQGLCTAQHDVWVSSGGQQTPVTIMLLQAPVT